MDKRISRQYFNNAASHWDETVRNNDPAKLRAMAKRLEFSPDARVLDVGTGTGVFVPYMQSKLNGGRGGVTCVDYAFRMLEIAQKKNGNEGIKYVCAEIETVKFSEGLLFDAVVCYSTFPHFHDKPRALENIYNLLTAGGKLFICHTASREVVNVIHQQISDLRDHLIPEEKAMRDMLTSAGFSEAAIANDAEYYLVEAKKFLLANEYMRKTIITIPG
ncbi:MAG: class I SAM-dependent methyltransferase [Anaerolineaceae bacterium]|nr:class I SAM-dependent methyltransferase [Anaerolineaceae bacterium]